MENNLDIVRGLLQGDEKSFEQVFHKYFKMIFIYAKSYVLDKEVARELAQESFLKLWEIKFQIRTDTNVSALLYTITRNNSINYLRQATANKKYIEYSKQKHYEYQLNYYALNDSTSDIIFFDELNEKIESAINNLPPKCKKVFELSRFNDLKYKEIAESLNISVKTVENQIVIALKRIHEQIKEYL